MEFPSTVIYGAVTALSVAYWFAAPASGGAVPRGAVAAGAEWRQPQVDVVGQFENALAGALGQIA